MATSEDGDPQSAAVLDVDPDIEWVTGIGRSTYFIPGLQPEGRERMPLLLRLKGISAEEFVSGKVNDRSFIDIDDQRWAESFEILSLENASFLKTAPSVLSMATDDIRENILSPERAGQFVESVTLGRPLPFDSLPPLAAQAKRALSRPAPTSQYAMTTSATPQPVVVMGIIDDGIAFAHERFRMLAGAATKTRVERWWLQDGKFDGSAAYGRAMDRTQIDAMLATCITAGQLDEELFYRKAFLLDYSQDGHKSAAWRAAHGTHVMDLACGFDPVPARTDRPIVCVQLPTRVTERTYGGHLGPKINHGIKFIIDHAKTLALSRPVKGVVINISYGVFAGPHDGHHQIERDIEDRIVEAAGLGLKLRVVLPAGNSFLERTHAQFPLAPGDVVSLPWRVLPDDQTPSFVQIWLPGVAPTTTAGSRLTLTIKAPDGTSYAIAERGGTVPFGPLGGHFGHAKYSVSPFMRGRFTIKLKGTAHIDASPPDAPSGAWTIEFRCTNAFGADKTVQAWVQRDDSLYGFPLRGRQSYFDDPLYERFDPAGRDLEIDNVPNALVRRENTLNAFATGGSSAVIVMGGYLRKENPDLHSPSLIYAKYSSAGPLAAVPPRPDALMVTEDSRVHGGVLAAGSRSGSVVAMGGTSVAAPQIARIIADDLATGGNGDRAYVWGRGDFYDGNWPAEAYRAGHRRIFSPPLVPLRRYD